MLRQLAARPYLLAVAIALVQTVALAIMIADRAWLVSYGREIVLPVIPVDPRSLFRGDYVVLSYDISRVPAPKDAANNRDGRTLYVTLQRRPADGRDAWAAVASSRDRPTEAADGDDVVLAARQVGQPYRGSDGSEMIRVRYGIESYFVPEGVGRDLERRVRDHALAVIAAVDRQGRTAIKGLVLDGQVRYDEPLF